MTECRAVMRINIPDRPGALGLVASRIGALKGDIVGIEIVDRTDGAALDELAVVLPDAELIPAVTREIHEVDGATVASVVVVEDFVDPRTAVLDAALDLARATERARIATVLLDALCSVLQPRWCAVTSPGGTAVRGTPPADPSELEAAATARHPLGEHGVVMVGRATPLGAHEHRVFTRSCDLAALAWARLPAD
ncbi:MAG: hypothetical protein ACXVJ7_11815 [Acidimicrobiia bacterium]